MLWVESSEIIAILVDLQRPMPTVVLLGLDDL